MENINTMASSSLQQLLTRIRGSSKTLLKSRNHFRSLKNFIEEQKSLSIFNIKFAKSGKKRLKVGLKLLKFSPIREILAFGTTFI